jgi:uncharacterized coiled-coil protein SlyX
MNNEDTIARSQKRLDVLTEGLRELIGELTDALVAQNATIEKLQKELADIIPVRAALDKLREEKTWPKYLPRS